MRKQRRTRSLSPHFMLVCEGETEVGYFHYVNGLLRPARISVRSTHDRDVAPEAIVRRAIEFVDGNPKRGIEAGQFDQVWAVFDWDNHTDEVRRAIALAERHGVRVALSNPCFDVWLIWHWRDFAQSQCDAAQTDVALHAAWPRYRKGHDNPWHELQGSLHDASRRARLAERRLHDRGLAFPHNRPSSQVVHLMDGIAESWKRTGIAAQDCPVG